MDLHTLPIKHKINLNSQMVNAQWCHNEKLKVYPLGNLRFSVFDLNFGSRTHISDNNGKMIIFLFSVKLIYYSGSKTFKFSCSIYTFYLITAIPK